ncbi:DNA polymerase III subunit alpha [Telmatocola sphagniphila]|uniref:DNA polymerase III subunit alpha n=1 Tax=Telmatocola sphagniphila TaxID=1123043 RepID=A0A8E6B7W5_9BACT|nr:DNA polymerase III subunit alpha [Telmatocola sphagniphila]QVL32751.1 DNA polymerase III subunit alpha [Telmatocola sphagniphila]
MAEKSFAHLHCHSHYSLLDGANQIPDLIKQTKKLGMNSIALTDHGNLYGAIEFYREAKAQGINPIIGYEAYIAPGKRTEKAVYRKDAAYHLTLLAQNATGFKNLIKLASIAYLEGFSYVPRIDKELLEQFSEGLICLSGCLSGEFNEHLLKTDVKEAKKLAEWYAQLFGDRFFIEIQNNGLDIQDACTDQAVRIADKLGVPLVATADAHYLCSDDAVAHDVLICINTGAKQSDEKRMRYGDNSRFKNPFYVRSPKDMYDLFPKQADAVARSQEIANSVDIQIDFKKRHFPVFDPPKGKTPEQYLRDLCEIGVRERYGDNPKPEVLARFEHELGIICRMGFAGYFLIVWDFVRFAHEQGIPASARGSACGALVSYVLKLSHVCPLEYDLLFERFLDPNRSEAPDIDIDFCQDRREMVIQYVKRKYGENSVAQIATFGTMAAKAALKDVGRVLDIPLDRVNMMTKFVASKPGTTLTQTLKESSEFKREYETDPRTREWVDIALRLEGMNRNAGTHAAGVVIANGPLTDYCPVQVVKRKDGDERTESLTTQWQMGDLEKVGMLKMDFLGLRTLSLVDNTLINIKKTRGITLDLQKIKLDDKPTYQLLQRGETKGVFQFESEGIRELLKRMKPDNIRDIIACTALYRPGPLEGGMVDEYIDCKHRRKQPTYPHEIMKSVLEETYGVMVYQEQVMRILNQLGGIELSNAYACIKAISKKNKEIIDARKKDFIKGAMDKGLGESKADDIFELIVKFGGYGFNKSHSAAYALLSYQTAYLKHHFPAEFMAALLSSEIDDGNKRDMLVDHIGDAKKMGVQVLPPDVNRGEAMFTVSSGNIAFGLMAIKGVGRGAAEEIAAVRQSSGAYKDLFDFCERVDTSKVTKSAIERIIKAGAMDGFAKPFGHRFQLLTALPTALQAASDLQQDRKRGQKNIFDAIEDDSPTEEGFGTPVLPDVPRWNNLEQLKHEKESLDFYFSSHPLADFDTEMRRYASHTIEMLRELDAGQSARIGGMLSSVRLMTTKTGKRYVRCKIEDFSGQIECVMWPDDFARFNEMFHDDKIYLFEAELEKGMREEPTVILRKLMTLEDAKKELTRGVILRMSMEKHHGDTVERLANLLKRAPGPCGVELHVTDAYKRKVKFRLAPEFQVNPQKLPLEEMEMLLGDSAIVFSAR